jgi:hypothetical protein
MTVDLEDRSVVLGGLFPSIHMLSSVAGEARADGGLMNLGSDWLALASLSGALSQSFEIGCRSEGSMFHVVSTWRSL